MEKSILRKFATESRKLLMTSVENQLKKYHIDEEFSKVSSGDLVILKNDKYTLPPMTKEDSVLRDKLISRVKQITKDQVIEEAAYTWFNRIIAIRYMELHDMLPLTKDNQSLNIRVLSSKDGVHPEILKMNNLTNSALDLNIDLKEYSKLSAENEQFNYVLKKVCSKLGKLIPQIFDGYTDYIDVLLPDNMLLKDNFVYKLIIDVPEECFDTVEVIGWLYQFYNQEEKEKVMADDKTYENFEIPFVTQLFTPDWIVKYMVENSLGRVLLENGCDKKIINNFSYYIDYNNNTNRKKKQNIQEITFIDPCSGSGHILVYAFELFYKAYQLYGYSKNEIPELILKNNLYGLDIDDRAGQLSVLSVLLKAREYDQNIFNKEIIKDLNIISLQESNYIDISNIGDRDVIREFLDIFKNVKTIGSIVKLSNKNYNNILDLLENTIFDNYLYSSIVPLLKQVTILQKKYSVIVTNPPYMGLNNFNQILYNYVIDNYNDFKNDLYCCCLKRFFEMLDEDGILSMISQQSFMINSRYKNAREYILNNMSFYNLVYLGPHAFDELSGEVVQAAAYTLRNINPSIKDTLFIDIREGISEQEKEKMFLYRINNINADGNFIASFDDFKKIDGFNMSYWLSHKVIEIIHNYKNLLNYGKARHGLVTGNITIFSKYWFEVDNNNILFNNIDSQKTTKKWYPYSNGGHFRKWYGNRLAVVDWENDGKRIRNYKDKGKIKSSNYNDEVNFKRSITWTDFSTGLFSCRLSPIGELFDTAGPSYFLNNDDEKSLYVIMALMNSKVSQKFLNIYKTGIHYSAGAIEHIPVDTKIFDDYILNLSMKCLELSKEDWDSFETSWDFTKHPLLKPMSKVSSIRDSLNNWNNYTSQQRSQLKHNEEELNKIFINIYGLQDEIVPDIEEQYISIRDIDKLRDIKSFISYFVGCLFGRYSLDEDRLIFAGGKFDSNQYKTFKADEDNIIPITDTEYFKDDIVGKFREFVKVTFGDQTLNENLDYIADTLGRKGNESSEQTIRRYFVNDFYKDHIQTYQKKPIYWLLDSGKKNGFKALIYMHRYDKDLISRVRLDYIGKVQTIYENRLKEIENDLNGMTELSTYDVKQLEKEQTALYEKLEEVKKYYVKLSTIGDKKIEIDLDNGVTENYKLFRYTDPETNEETNILGEDKIIVPKKK